MVDAKRHDTLTEGSIWKGLTFFAIPIMLSNLLQQLYNTIDSAVVGTFSGSTALAAVGSTAALINLLVGFFLGLSTGTGVAYATYFGAGDQRNLKKVMESALIMSVIIGVFLTIVGVAFTPWMLEMVGTPADVMEEAITYLRIYFSGILVMLIYNVGAGIIRAGGDSRRPLYYLAASGLTNLLLDLLFVAAFDMGVAGAAWATVISQVVSAVLVVIHMMRLPESYRLRLRELRLDKKISIQLIKLAVPCGLQSSMFNISNLLVQAKINTFGSTAMAGVAAYNKIDGFLYMPTMALSLAITTFVGQNIGAGKTERVRRGIRVCVILAAVIAAVIAGVILLLGRTALRLFTDDAAVMDYGFQMMWTLAPFAWLFTPSDILGGAIRGAGSPVQVTIISALCICVFRIVWLYGLLPFIPDIQVVFWCYPVSWVVSTFCMGVYYFKGKWMRAGISGESLQEQYE